MTEWERELVEKAIEWRDAKYSVEEALTRQALIRAIDMVKKERRDAQADNLRERDPE